MLALVEQDAVPDADHDLATPDHARPSGRRRFVTVAAAAAAVFVSIGAVVSATADASPAIGRLGDLTPAVPEAVIGNLDELTAIYRASADQLRECVDDRRQERAQAGRSNADRVFC